MLPPQATAEHPDESASHRTISPHPDASDTPHKARTLSQSSNQSVKDGQPADGECTSSAGRKRNRSNPQSGGHKHHQSNQSNQSNHPPTSSNDGQANLNNPFQRSKYKQRYNNRRNYYYDRHYDRAYDRGYDRHYDYQSNYVNRSNGYGKPFNGYKSSHHSYYPDTRFGKHYGDREQPSDASFKIEQKTEASLTSADFEKLTLSQNLNELDVLVRKKPYLNKKFDEPLDKKLEQQRQLKEIQYYEKYRQNVDKQTHFNGHQLNAQLNAQLSTNIENNMNQLNELNAHEQPGELLQRHQFKSQHPVDAHQLIRASAEHRPLEVHQINLQKHPSIVGLSSSEISGQHVDGFYFKSKKDHHRNGHRHYSPPMHQNGLFESAERSIDKSPLDRSQNSLHRQLAKHGGKLSPTSRPIIKTNNPTAYHKLPAEQPSTIAGSLDASMAGQANGGQLGHQSISGSPPPSSNQMTGYALVNGQLLTHVQLMNNPQLQVNPANLLSYSASAILHLNQSLEMKLNASLSGHKLLPSSLERNSSVNNLNHLNASVNNLNHLNTSANHDPRPNKSNEAADESSHGETPPRKSKQKAGEPTDDGPQHPQFKRANEAGEQLNQSNQSLVSSQSNRANGRVDGQPNIGDAATGSSTPQTASISQGSSGSQASTKQSKPETEKFGDGGRKATNGQYREYKDREFKDRDLVKSDYAKEKRPFAGEFKQRKNGKFNGKQPNAGLPRTASTNYTSYGPSYPKLIQNDVVSVTFDVFDDFDTFLIKVHLVHLDSLRFQSLTTTSTIPTHDHSFLTSLSPPLQLSSQIWKTYLLLRQTPESYQRKIELRQILYDVLREQFG